MRHPFSFKTCPGARSDRTEANIFIHGYSAGHSEEDQNFLLGKIPKQLRNYINIFSFWPSNHYLHFDKQSLFTVGAAGISLFTPLAPVALLQIGTGHYLSVASTFARDRRKSFTDARSRAELMGEVLLDQLAKYLLTHHPQVVMVNLIGHSLGGRVAVSCLKSIAAKPQLVVNDVLLMAAAVEVTPTEAREMR